MNSTNPAYVIASLLDKVIRNIKSVDFWGTKGKSMINRCDPMTQTSASWLRTI